MKTHLKNRMYGGIAACVIVAGMSASAAFTHGQMMSNGKMMSNNMMMMDTNHDGMVSSDEYMAHSKMTFDKMDTNHDGMLDKAEMEAGMNMMHDDGHMMKK